MNGNQFPAWGYFGSTAKLERNYNEGLVERFCYKLQEGILNYQDINTN